MGRRKLSWTHFIEVLGKQSTAGNVEFCKWIHDHSSEIGISIDEGDSGPLLHYHHDSRRYFTFGQLHTNGTFNSTHWLEYHCQKHGISEEVWKTYMDTLAAPIDGASRGIWVSSKGRERPSVMFNGSASLPLEYLAPHRASWFATIAEAVESIGKSLGGTAISIPAAFRKKSGTTTPDFVTKERRIYIFGNPDKTEFGFESPGNMNRYLGGEIFSKENGRYRYTQARNADVIVLSRDGMAHGHVEVEHREPPNQTDRKAYPDVKWVYVVHTSATYSSPVPLGATARRMRFGKRISEEEFGQIKGSAGSVTEFQPQCELPDALRAQERVLREIQNRLNQSPFRLGLLSAYDGRCAVSDYDAAAALQAAHIWEYKDSQWSDVSNGLLLRADIHLLFDAKLLGVHPQTRKVSLAPCLLETKYAEYDGKPLRPPEKHIHRPHSEALQKRWDEFQQAARGLLAR